MSVDLTQAAMNLCPSCDKSLEAHVILPVPKGARLVNAESFRVKCDVEAPEGWWTDEDVRGLLRHMRFPVRGRR